MVKKILKFFRGSVWQYIISYSSIIMLVILIMGTYLYQYYYKTIYDDFCNSNELFLNTFKEQYENDFQIMEDISTQIGISDTINIFSIYEKPMKSLPLKEQLYQYKSVSQSFNEVLLLFSGDTYLYNGYTSMTVDRFLRSGLILENVSGKELRNLLDKQDTAIRFLPEQKMDGTIRRYADLEKKCVLAFVPVHLKGTLLFVIGGSYYDKLLEYDEEDLRGNYILYNGEIIAERSMLSIDKKVISSYALDGGDMTIQVKENGNKYLITIRTGREGFQYCTVQSLEAFYQKIQSNQWGVLTLVLICCVVATFLMTALSKGMIKRVGNIKALLTNQEAESGDFSYIENGIRVLKEHNEELTQESIPLRRAYLIRKLVRNEYLDQTAIIQEGRKVGLDLNKKYYCVVLIGNREESFEKRTLEAMISMIEKEPLVSGYGIKPIINNQNLFILFADERERIENILKKLNEYGKQLCREFIVAVSNYHENIDEATLAYLEADTAYDNRFLIENSEILRFSGVAGNENVKALPEIYLNALRNAIRMGDENGMNRAISDICRYLQSSQQSLFAFRILYNNIIQLLIHEWNQDNVDFEHIYNVFTLSQCLTMQDFGNILSEICKILMGNKQLNMDDENNKMNLAALYMKENYGNMDLNMNMLADYLELSSVTLSVEFKKVMGMSPSDYLTLIRIERAKKLLEDTDMNIREISMAVGYDDAHGFMRRFKKYVGKTPAQYREERSL
ncbi:helix-turn-helix domain-containing protein [Eisenbergiella sp.]